MSIWDAPGAPTVRPDAVALPQGSAPVTGDYGRDHLLGTAGGRALLDANGRGVYDGVPLGTTVRDRAARLDAQYLLNPLAAERLRGATRATLGR